MSRIVDILGREIIDSRGNPDRRGRRACSNPASMGRAAVPSGASTGSREAVELRDGDKKRYGGKGVLQGGARTSTPSSARRCSASTRSDQAVLDRTLIDLDGTENKAASAPTRCWPSRWPIAQAAAEEAGLPLYRYLGGCGREPVMPVPMMNIINGGAHANNSLDIQEFMIMPVGAPSFPRGAALRRRGVPHAEEAARTSAGMPTAVGDEGGFAPNLDSNEAALEMILQAIEKAGYKPGKDISLGLDVAQLRVLQGRQVRAGVARQRSFTVGRVRRLSRDLARQVPDHHHRGRHGRGRLGRLGAADRARWASKMQLVGDDLFVTNTKILKEGIEKNIANCDPDQDQPDRHADRDVRRDRDGRQARGYTAVISHRSGETEDTTIADIAVATSARRRSRPARCRARTAWPSTTSCCASRPSSGACVMPASKPSR